MPPLPLPQTEKSSAAYFNWWQKSCANDELLNLAEVHLPQDYEADYAGLTILTFSCQFLADGR